RTGMRQNRCRLTPCWETQSKPAWAEELKNASRWQPQSLSCSNISRGGQNGVLFWRPVLAWRAKELAFCRLGSRVLSANMGGKFFVALQLVALFHFRERVAGGRPLRIEHPCAFGATAAPKTRLFNPD